MKNVGEAVETRRYVSNSLWPGHPATARLFVDFEILRPLIFLGGCFYSISMLPPVWQTGALFNPVVYLISLFRWSIYGISDVNMALIGWFKSSADSRS